MKHGEKTRKRILEAGVKLWPNPTLSNVAREIGLAHSAILYHFKTESFRDDIAAYAVETGNSRVIIQLIAEDHPAVADLSPGERNAHFASV